jgi:hypothetical protein
VVNLVVWLHMLLGPSWCMSVALVGISLIPNTATDIHQQGPNNIYSHTTNLTTLMCFDYFNSLNPELNPICYLLALLGAHHCLHVSRIRVKSLTFRQLMSYIYGAPILDVSRPHTTHQSVGLLWTSDQLVAETST